MQDGQFHIDDPKPKFNPNKPFSVVKGGGAKPVFDPNKPFIDVKKKESGITEPLTISEDVGTESPFALQETDFRTGLQPQISRNPRADISGLVDDLDGTPEEKQELKSKILSGDIETAKATVLKRKEQLKKQKEVSHLNVSPSLIEGVTSVLAKQGENILIENDENKINDDLERYVSVIRLSEPYNNFKEVGEKIRKDLFDVGIVKHGNPYQELKIKSKLAGKTGSVEIPGTGGVKINVENTEDERGYNNYVAGLKGRQNYLLEQFKQISERSSEKVNEFFAVAPLKNERWEELKKDPDILQLYNYEAEINEIENSRLPNASSAFPSVKFNEERQYAKELKGKRLKEQWESVASGLSGTPDDDIEDVAEMFGITKERAKLIYESVDLPSILGQAWRSAGSTIESMDLGIRRLLNDQNVDLLSKAVDQSKQARSLPKSLTTSKDNISLAPALFTVADVLGQVAVYASTGAIGGRVTGALGKTITTRTPLLQSFTRAGQLGSTFSSGFTSSYEDAYQEGLRNTKDEGKAREYANFIAGIVGASELILPDVDIARRLAGARKLLFKDFGAKDLTSKDTFLKGLGQFAKGLGRVVIPENIEEQLPIIGKLFLQDNILGRSIPTNELIDESINTAIQTTIGTFPLGLIGGARRQTSGFTKANYYEAGLNKGEHIKRFEDAFTAGQISEEEKNKNIQIVNTLAGIVGNISTDKNGNKLTQEQKHNLAYSILQKRIAEDEKKKTDPALSKYYDEDIKASEQEIDAVMEGGKEVSVITDDEQSTLNDAIGLVTELADADQLPDVFKQQAINNPQEFLQFIHEQSSDPKTTQATKDQFSETLVNTANEVFPIIQKQKDNERSTQIGGQTADTKELQPTAERQGAIGEEISTEIQEGKGVGESMPVTEEGAVESEVKVAEEAVPSIVSSVDGGEDVSRLNKILKDNNAGSLKEERVSSSDLISSSNTPNKELREEMEENGVVPILVDDKNNVLDGERRLATLKDMGITNIPIFRWSGNADFKSEEASMNFDAEYKTYTKSIPLEQLRSEQSLPKGEPKEAVPSIKAATKKQGVFKKAKGIEDLTEPRDIVMQHFANGGKINSSAIKELFGGKDERIRQNVSTEGERRSRISMLGKNAPSIKQLAHQLWEADKSGKYTDRDFINAIEEVIQGFTSPAAMATDLVDRYVDQAVRQELSEKEAKEIDEISIGKLKSITENIPEDQQDQLVELLKKYQDNNGFVDWESLEKDINGFDPDILSLPEQTQTSLYGLVEEYNKSGQSELSNTDNQSVPITKEEKTSEQANAPPTETITPTIAEQGKALADRIRQLKTKRDVLQANIFGIPIAIYDGAIEAIATAIENGAILADAITRGIKYIRDNGGKDLDEKKFTEHIEDFAAGKKPKITTTGEIIEEEKPVSGIKKALVSEDIVAGVNLDTIGDKEMMALGRKIINKGDVKPKALVDKIVRDGKGVLTPSEVVALITYKADIDNELRDAYKRKNDLSEAGRDLGTVNSEIKNLENEVESFDIMSVITAQQQSMAFRLRKMLLDRDYNIVTRIEKYKSTNNGYISPEVEARLRDLDKQLKEVKEKLADAEKIEEDRLAQEAIDNIKEDIERSKYLTDEEIEQRVKEGVAKEIQAIHDKLPSELRKRSDKAVAALEAIQKKLRSKTYDAGLGIPVAIIDAGITVIKNAIKVNVAIAEAIELGISRIKELYGQPWDKENDFRKDMRDGFKEAGFETKSQKEKSFRNKKGELIIPPKMIRDFVKRGITDINELTDAVLLELEKEFPDITSREVRDAITGYGKNANPTKDEVQKQINTAKRIGRLLSELEDTQNSKQRTKSKSRAAKLSQKEIELKRQIKTLQNNLPKEEKEIDEQETLEKTKERVRQSISKLQQRIIDKDFSKPIQKKKIEDNELIRLRSKKEAIQEYFDKEQYKIELKNRTFWQKAGDAALELISALPRALVASIDFSAVLIQGAVRTFTKPAQSVRAMGDMFKQFASEKTQKEWENKIKAQPWYHQLEASKLSLTEVGGKLAAREELFIGDWVNHIWSGVGKVLTLGNKRAHGIWDKLNPYKASNRAYVGYLNSVRVQAFLEGAKFFEKQGMTFESNPEVFKEWAGYVNNSTGRGSLGGLERSAKALSLIFFAPRKISATLKLLSPYSIIHYAKMPAIVRKKALLNFAQFMTFSTTASILGKVLASDDDDDEFWNPNSSDFLTIRVGNTRIDLFAGYKQQVVLMSRLWSGNFTDANGKTTRLGDRFGKEINTKFDAIEQYFSNKLSPLVALGKRKFDEKKGLELEVEEEIINTTLPIWVQDVKELYKEQPGVMGVMFNLLSVFGAGIRTYETAASTKALTIYNPDEGTKREATKEEVELFEKRRSEILTEELKQLNEGQIGLNIYGEVTTDENKIEEYKDAKDLTEEEKKKLKAIYSAKATREAKKELFGDDNE